MKASFPIDRFRRTFWLLFATLYCAGLDCNTPVHAQSPPQRMTYQGFLVGTDGTPLANTAPKNYDLVFRIHDEETGGNILWGEAQTVTVDKGYFSVLLGEGTGISGADHDDLSTLFKGAGSATRYISINIQGVDSIQPRLRFLTSPYSFLSTSTRKLVSDTGVELITGSGSQLSLGGNLTALTLTATNFTGNGAAITNLNASNIGSGTLASDRIPGLNANKISAGTLAVGRIPDLDAGKILTGAFDVARIPDLNASKITAGTFGAARIPALDANKITTGTLDSARLNTDIARRNTDNTFTAVTSTKVLASTGIVYDGFGYAFQGDGDTGICSLSSGKVNFFGNSSHIAEISDDNRFRIFGIKAGNGSPIEMDSNSTLVKDSSSRRYKTNIVELQDDFDRILQAQPKRYSRHHDTNRFELGFIAEDLHALGLTNLVYYDNERRPESIHYAKITIYLNEVAKAQQREIAGLKSARDKQAEKLAQQEEELKAMRSRFGELEAFVRRAVAAREPDQDRQVAARSR